MSFRVEPLAALDKPLTDAFEQKLSLGHFYTVGDRVQLGGIMGDVIGVQTTLLPDEESQADELISFCKKK